jgi:molybdopterin converting factor small subunit
MQECDHCGATFDDEDAYLSHLAAEHREQLGRIEEKRVESHEADQGGGRTQLYLSVAAVAVIAALAAFGIGTLFTGGGGGDTIAASAQNAQSPMAGGGDVPAPAQDQVALPQNPGATHDHGPMTVEIDGEQLDFSRDRFQVQDDYFHFEPGDLPSNYYHLHAQRITLEYGLETLGIGVTNSTLSYNGTVYDDDDPNQRVVYRVNGEEVNPELYKLSEGDEVTVIAEHTAGDSDAGGNESTA